MDEEEQQQSDSKINVSSFFERVDSVEKVANSALSKANENLGVINTQKVLINSINVSIEAMQTKIRDIANYIIIEKKLEKDAEEDRLFEKQDEEQKGSMLERLAGLKSNNESEQTQTAPGEEPKKGGGGILGTLLSLGIGAFALKFLWPAILPAVGTLLKGVLAKSLMFTIGGIGTLIKGLIIGSGLTGIGFGIGGLFKMFADSAENNSNKVAESAAKAVENFSFDKEGKVSGPDSLSVDIGGGEGGGEEVEKENLVNGDKSMRDTLKDKDLVPAESFSEYRNRTGNVESGNDNEEMKEFEEEVNKLKEEKTIAQKTGETDISKELKKEASGGDEELSNVEVGKKGKEMVRYKYKGYTATVEKGSELDSLSKGELADKYAELHKRWGDDPKSFTRKEKRLYKYELPGFMMAKHKLFYGNIESVLQGGYSMDPFVTNRFKEQELEPELEPVTENKDLDQNLSESFTDKLQPLNDQIDTLSEDFTGSINGQAGEMFSRPANSPNTTVTVFKQTSSNSPFTSLMSNKYLSLNSVLPPEVYRAIK